MNYWLLVLAVASFVTQAELRGQVDGLKSRVADLERQIKQVRQ